MAFGGALVAAALGALLWLATCAHEERKPDPPAEGSGPTGTPRGSSAATPASSPAASSAPLPSGEPALMAELRAVVDSDPSRALALAAAAEQAAPASPLADERAWLKMRALVHLGRIGEARGEARRFFAEHPQSPYGERVARLTGAHPRPRPGPQP